MNPTKHFFYGTLSSLITENNKEIVYDIKIIIIIFIVWRKENKRGMKHTNQKKIKCKQQTIYIHKIHKEMLNNLLDFVNFKYNSQYFTLL